MELFKATLSDLIEILYLLRVCIIDMNEKGMKQWNSAYPERSVIRRFLEEGKIYLVKERWVCKGMITISDDEPEDHIDLQKPGIKATLFLRWLAIHPLWQGKGIDRMLINFAEKFAAEKGYLKIKLDVFSSSDMVNHLVKEFSFSEVGKFYTSYQKIPFICYEKQLD